MRKYEVIFSCLILMLAATTVLPCSAQTGLRDGRVTVAASVGINPPADFTLEAWIRPTLFYFTSDDTAYQEIIYKWWGGQRSYLLCLCQDRVEFAMTLSGTYSNSAAVFSDAHLTLGQWVHVAGVYAGGTLALFINGERAPQTAYLPGSAFQGSDSICIGGTPNSSYQRFHGGIDEVRISYCARYTGDCAVPSVEFSPDSATALLMHLNEGVGTFTDNVGLLGGDGTLDAVSAWGEGAPIAPPQLADLNCDGQVDFADIDPFVLALSNGSGYVAAYPNCDRDLADCNGDGFIDFGDIDPFVALLSAAAP